MTYTRRRFLEATGALAAAAGLGRAVGPHSQSPARIRQSGAPGVELNVDGAALPDYSRDLERYLVRLANDARERRKRVINAISTRQEVLDRQKAVVAELWKMLGGPLDRTPLNARVTGTVERPGYRIEKLTFESRPRLYVTANLYVPAGTGRRPAILGRLAIRRMARRGRATRSCSRTWRARATSSSRTTRSGRVNASSTREAGPASLRSAAEEPASTSTPDAASSCSAPTSACSACGTASAASTTC